MRDRLHFAPAPSTELDSDRLRYAGQPMELLTGGAGMFNQPPAPSGVPVNANGAVIGAGRVAGLQPHHGAIGVLLAAVLVLLILDRLGFRFAVTAGKR